MAFGIHHVHLKTRDPKQTMQFYVDHLGATLMAEVGSRGYRVNLHGLTLNITSLIDTQTCEQHYGMEHIAVDTDDYPRTLARLRANGVRVLEELPPTNGRRVCFLEAPDGVQIEVIEKVSPLPSGPTNVVKQQVAAHWDRRAPHFDEDFGHSIRTPAERAAWDRILDLVLVRRGPLEALDAGCGTGFLSFELAARGHRVTGVDFAPAMLAEARRKAAERGVSIRFEEADAELLPFPPGSFDLVISRHLLWTLAHPEAAIDEWIRVLRSGGRLVVVDSQVDAGSAPPSSENARASQEYAAIGDQLPFLGGRSRQDIEMLLEAHGLVNAGSDPLLDLVAAQEQRMVEEGRERRTRRRYVVWGDVAR